MSEEKKKEITVRFVEDTKNDYCWFEEKLNDGNFYLIPSTKTRCEGNSRTHLEEELERRRQERIKIYLKHHEEQTFTI